jgi:hypothetical protein
MLHRWPTQSALSGTGAGAHIYNHVDKPDFTMNSFVAEVNRIRGRTRGPGFRLPFVVGYSVARGIDLVAWLSGRKFAISGIRVRKFCADSVYCTGTRASFPRYRLPTRWNEP